MYRQMSCQGITRQSAVLYSLLTQTIEAPKKRNRTVRLTNIQKEKRKRMIVSKTMQLFILLGINVFWKKEERELFILKGITLSKYRITKCRMIFRKI